MIYRLLPLSDVYATEDALCSARFILEKYEFPMDLGESNENEGGHDWDNDEDEYHPPKADSYASDTASVVQVQIFDQTPSKSVEFKDDEKTPTSSAKKHGNYLSLNVLKSLDNNNGQINKSDRLELKSTTSKKTSVLYKYKMKALKHLNGTNAVTKQEPLPQKIDESENGM